MARTLREDLQTLLLVQEADSRWDKARAAIAALDSGTHLVAQYNTCKAQAEELRGAIAKVHGAQKDAELKLASLEEKRQQVEMSLMTAGVAPRELENLQKELEMIERQRETAEEVALLAMDSTGDTDAQAQELEKKMGVLAARYKKIRAVYKEQHALSSAEAAQAEKERVVVALLVSSGLLKKYETVRVKRSGIGVAAVGKEDSCGACHTRLHTGLAQAVRAAEEPQICEFCGRLLVHAI